MTCTLCGIESPIGIEEDNRYFCCAGCRAVFQILKSKGDLENPLNNPVYLEALRLGVIKNGAVEKKVERFQEVERRLIEIEGMWCPSCAEVISILVSLEKGVKKCAVDYTTDLAIIDYFPQELSFATIKEQIQKLSYYPKELEETAQKSPLTLQMGIAGFSALNLMMFAYPIYSSIFDFDEQAIQFAWISALFSLPLIYSAYPILKRFWQTLKVGILGMEALISIGFVSAFILSFINLLKGSSQIYFDSAGVIIFFVLFGKWIEIRSKGQLKDRFFALSRTLPQKARNEKGGAVLLKEIQVGDRLIAGLGETLGIEGEVLKGEGWVSESALTGEATPLFKQKGDTLLAGSRVESGSFTYLAKTLFKKSLIYQLYESCIEKSPPIKTEFISYFILFVLSLFLIFTYAFNFERGLSLLFIACPCAIGIASPLVQTRLMTLFSEKGVLIRNRSALGPFAEGNIFIFDKTGTLTKGNMVLETDAREWGGLIKGLAKISQHPMAKAIINKITDEPEPFDHILEVCGKGIKGVKNGSIYLLGSKTFLMEEGIATAEKSENSEALFVIDGDIKLILNFSDEVRGDIDALPHSKILLSGDRKEVVQAYANKLGFTEFYAEQSPFEKHLFIKKMKTKGKVVFIGDGLNDAPSLKEADASFAMGDSGALSAAAADFVFIQENLNLLIPLQALAKKGKKIIKQNLFWAFFYNMIALLLAAMGILNPLIASLAMILSSTFVIVNSMRLR